MWTYFYGAYSITTTLLYVMGIASFINLLYVIRQTRRGHVLSLLYFALKVIGAAFLLKGLKSTENWPDSGFVCISETGAKQPGVTKKSKCNLAEKPTKSLTVDENIHA